MKCSRLSRDSLTRGGEKKIMNLTKRFTIAIATGAVLLNAIAPSTYAYSLTVSGNGSGSVNDVSVEANNDVNVTQNNEANVDNTINVKAETGNNDANGNVGGNVEIETGDADAEVRATTVTNVNKAHVHNCCTNDANVKISGNGSDSDNEVVLNLSNNTVVNQDNYADVNNNIDVDANTGYNNANDNVGGDVEVETGDTSARVSVLNAANANTVTLGHGNGNGGSISAWITGNGSDSDNLIDLDLNNDVDVDQENDADIDNNVYVDGITGYNDANDNVGGDVVIETGDADADVTVDTFVNFNGADVDSCGCLSDLEAKIKGNGSDSDNEIQFDADNNTNATQDNDADVDNNLDVEGETGYNNANDNVGEAGTDPSVETGDADSVVEANTASNANVFGAELDFEWDWDDFLGWMGL